MRRNLLGILVFSWVILQLSPSQAAPVISSTVPLNGASGVSTSAPVVFTFSEAMDPALTDAMFYDNTFNFFTTSAAWSLGNTRLTCTPSPAFPANRLINWVVSGTSALGADLGGIPLGSFTTGAGSGGGGSGTNAITTFSVGKVHHYNQTSSASPALDPTTPYDFSAVTSLASNRTATSVTLTLPTAAVSSLMQIPFQPELFILYGTNTSLSAYDATYPAGNYSFFVQAATSNQTVVVNLPDAASLPQPGAPYLTNYLAAQAVNPSQQFVLGWDAFPGGTATEYIYVEIGANYHSPNPGTAGALSGTARTFTIPVGVLQPNTTYDSTIGFYRPVSATNASFATTAYRATFTDFTLITTSGGVAGGPLVLTNASWSSGVFSFDVLCTNGQIVTIEYTTNILSAGPWPKLVTATNTGTPPHIVSPQAATNNVLFYRARNGP